MELATIKPAPGFYYSDEAQGSPEWVAVRVGKLTASNLYRWMSVSKRDGKPLKARFDYEQELAYERQFGVPFNRFTTRAMEEGQQFEEFLKQEYANKMGVVVRPSGAFYNDLFVASPDGLVGDDGIVEAKWFYDASFADVLINGVPEMYMWQIQGQLWASGREWCDFVVGSNNTGKFKVIRVYPDEKMQLLIAAAALDSQNISYTFDSENVFDFTKVPEVQGGDWS